MKEKKKRQRLTPEQLDANYHKFMKDKELADNGKEVFEKVIKKATEIKALGKINCKIYCSTFAAIVRGCLSCSFFLTTDLK